MFSKYLVIVTIRCSVTCSEFRRGVGYVVWTHSLHRPHSLNLSVVTMVVKHCRLVAVGL